MEKEFEKLSAENSIEQIEQRNRNARIILNDFLVIKPNEKVLFLTDENSYFNDQELLNVIQNQLKEKNIKFSELIARNYTTLSDIFLAFDKYDVIWNTWAMEDASDDIDFHAITKYINTTGKRMAWCPGVKIESLDNDGSLAENKEEMEARLEKMATRLNDAVGL